MSFTDEDLKRLKEGLTHIPDFGFEAVGVGKMHALLSRLEAAEKLLREYVPEQAPDYNACKKLAEEGQCTACELVKVWRKAAGK